ncbi:MAG: DinB family protein [Pirellulaceae bacterium]|nr:DinB family protein [Pirellulaceae bacterium]
MNSRDILKSTLGITNMVINSYIGDMSDSDLLKRPGVGCNHIAWQLGHLIKSNCDILNQIAPGSSPALPANFAENHAKSNNSSDDASQFCGKNEYLDLMKKLDAALIASIDKTSDADLEQPSPESFRSWCPKLGDMYVLLVTHSLMHAGQWVPVRRMLDKPVVI